MKNFFWITFVDETKGSISAENGEQAVEKAERISKKQVKKCEHLPYPASPKIDTTDDFPTFCFQPESCKGRMSCPRSRSYTS